MKRIEKNIIVNAPVKKVFEDVSTTNGTQKFFAPKTKVELKLNGSYEVYFDKGLLETKLTDTIGMKILSFVPNKMISFEWKNLSNLENIINYKTWVTIFLEEITNKQTKVKLIHIGWKEGEEWDVSFNYFVRFWDVVLFRLQYYYNHGTIDWDNPVYPPHLAQNN